MVSSLLGDISISPVKIPYFAGVNTCDAALLLNVPWSNSFLGQNAHWRPPGLILSASARRFSFLL